MASRQLDEEVVFQLARKLDDLDDRLTYLDQVCGRDAPLRERVEALLLAHEQEQAFLKSGSSEPPSTADAASPTVHAGNTIGRYRLMEQIGEGGMGIVFVAEQEKPLRRKVALKVIKPGMDSKAVIARFEAERQALAIMDHPNIAKVFDAGTTESGLPYFVMELVRGIPITDYCDGGRLPIRERLALFVEVCQAIQHAHQKGIIHRDIKPTNILVTEQDGKPVPHVIDFGVAKALSERLTDRTVYTSFQAIVGTPMYMSPEQAAISGVDVDTRSDVYSLGVLLYELLTGTPPFAKARFDQAAYDEIRRLIREEEPPKPSTRISTLGDTALSIAQHRSTDPRRLRQTVSRDLDWIVMKALEKDRGRRYDAASAFAADVSRYLNNDVVEARSPTTLYRLSRFVRRNKGLMTAAAIVVSALILGITCTSAALVMAWKQKGVADDALAKAQVILFDKALWYALAGDVDHTRRAMQKAKDVRFPAEWPSFAEGVAFTWAGDQGHEARECFAKIPSDAEDFYAVCAASSFVVRTDRDLADIRQRLHSLSPSTPLDYLFQVQVETWLRPERGLQALEKCGEWKDSTLAAYSGGLARVNRSLELNNVSMARTAVNTLDDLLGWYPSNPVPQCAELYALLAVQNISRRSSDPESALQYEPRAKELVKSLEEPSERIFWVARTRAWYFAENGNGVQAIEEWKKRIGREPFGMDAMHYAACVLLFGNTEDADRAVMELPDNFGLGNAHARLAKAYLLASTSAPVETVVAACNQVVELDDSPEMYCGTVEACLAAGDVAAGKQFATAALLKLGKGEDHWRTVLEYIANDLPEEEFIRRFDAPMFQGMPDYYVGLKCLGAGELDRARPRFQNCCDSGRFLATWYWWSKVFLARIDTLGSKAQE